MEIFGNVMRGLGAALDLYEVRHRVISENIANVETPGYRARDLEFDDALKSAFSRDDAERQGEIPEPVVDKSAVTKIDGNSIDVDVEMTRLSDNAFRIVALSRILAKEYAGLKEAIGDLR